MNKVDIYVGTYLLDLFQDEQISINLSTQNIKDISKIFTDFTQTFTVPASLRITRFWATTSAQTLTSAESPHGR